MIFQLKKSHKLKELFNEHPVWAEYYNPDDIDNLVRDGYQRTEIIKALELVDYSNDYVFPVVNYNNESPYEFTLYKSKIIFPNLITKEGYLFYIKNNGVNSLTVYHEDEEYVLNISDPEITEADEAELKEILQVNAIYPLQLLCEHGLKINKIVDPYTK